MTIRPKLAVALASLAASGLVLAACSTKVDPGPQCDFSAYKDSLESAEQQGPVLVAQTPGSITDIPLNAVNIVDQRISNKVLVQATNAKRLEGGQVKAFARMVNCTDYALQVEGRTHFLNEAQAPVEEPTAWKRIFLAPHTIGTYETASTARSSVATYYIELREGT